jgi:hypothetical protein
MKFSFSTFPEQRDGLRYLADTRSVTSATSLGAVMNAVVYGDFDLDMLAVGRPETQKQYYSSNSGSSSGLMGNNKNYPADLEIVKIHFSEVSKFLVGKQAQRSEFIKHAEVARYIYLSEVPTSNDGGFTLSDGDLTLSDIRGLNLQAMTVFISPAPDHNVQVARVEAFLQAGAKSVVVQTWQLPVSASRNMLDQLFISLKRNDPLLLAMKKTREKYISDQFKAKSESPNNPGIWGGYSIFGRP